MKFNKNKIKELEKELEKVAKKFDSDCDLDVAILGAFHSESFDLVSRRLQIKIDFTPFDE